jgi:hypothetical protein
MSEQSAEVVIPAESAGLHNHPHTHDQFDHTHPEILAELEAIRAAHEAEQVADVAVVAAAGSEAAAVDAVIEAEEAKTEVQILREEMQAGFAAVQQQMTVVPAVPAAMPDEQVVEEPAERTTRREPKKDSGWKF